MAVFVARRLGVSALTLLLSSFLVYLLVANAGDPLADLRADSGPDKAQRIARRIAELQLDQPVARRYLGWLRGVTGCVVPTGACDLGRTQRGQDVGELLGQAAGATVRLVTVATVIAIVVGVVVGVLAALRRDTGVDRAATLTAFALVSLPVFWVAVVAKQYLAIAVNDWYADPRVSPVVAVAAGVVNGALGGALWGALRRAAGGGRRRRWVVRGAVGTGTAGLLLYLSAAGWFRAPALGPVVIAALSLGAAVVVGRLVEPGRRAGVVRASGLAVAVVGGLAQFWLTPWLLSASASALSVLLLVAGAAASAVAVGRAAEFVAGRAARRAGLDRPARLGPAVRGALATAAVLVLLLLVDALLRSLPGYGDLVNGRLLPTVGSRTPDLGGLFWQRQLDTLAHLFLPTLTLVLVASAPYVRYVRAGVLDVLGEDYVRTAEAKGLPWSVVVVRHALRSALVPVVTLAALDVGLLISGTVVTETVFGWQGMGQLFIGGLLRADPPPVMAFYLVTGASVAVVNLLADIAYLRLDPRILRT